MISLIYLFSLVSLVKTSDYSLIIDEKSSIDKPILNFPHSYELINNFQSNFNLTNNNTKLILTKMIDRDEWCAKNICPCDYCSFILELFSNHNQIPKFSTVNITINDINDHTCEFFDTQTNISLSESIQIGHRFSIARAIDYDSGMNGKLSFKLLNNEDYFELDIITLSMNEYAIYGVVKKSFDREINEKYELIIEAHDHGLLQTRFNRTKVIIELLDENDNAPKFNQIEYSIQSLPENTPIGTELLTISASDTDKGLNSLIHYSIVNSPSLSLFPFAINSTTGVISLQSSLDYETTHTYRFLIRASDSGLQQSLFNDAWCSISIKDVNDCPVEILFLPNRRFHYDNQKLFIYENTEINNLTLGYIRLVDRDSIQTKLSISLTILDKQPKQEYEIILSNQLNSYILIAKQGIFDREIQSEINLRFIATDNLLTSIYDIQINLIDLNDNPSEFLMNPMKFSVEELANYHMVEHPIEDYELTIGYLNVVDRDEGENAVNIYELESNSLVKIDSNTGRLYLIQPLDREQIQNIQLKAKAINVAEPKWMTDVQIQIEVLDVNDNTPQCLTTYSRLPILENFPTDKPLIKINASDLDNGINGTINYKFRTNSTWLFHINNVTGEIYSKDLFDYESDFKHFTLIIDLEDNGNPIKNQNQNACQLEIFLEDINDNCPELIDNEQRKIFIDLENPFENEIISFNVTDRDSGINGKIKYNLQSIESNINLNNNQTLFYLNQNGSLFMTYKINQICLFKLRILLEDYGYPSQQTLIEINIAFGNSLDSRYSSFENVQTFFQEKNSDMNYFAFIFGLTVLIITFIFLISVMIICILIRQQHQRHKAAIISRNKLLCSSSQQLTTSDSTVTSNTTSSSIEHQQIIRAPYSNERSYMNPRLSINCSTPESHTYKILHVPLDMHYYEKDKVDNISSDHGYHESYRTGSSSSSSSPEQCSTENYTRQDHKFNQLPYFVTKCKSLSEGFIVEMNVDGSDEDTR
ncbi:unnamed protein product [Rotaria socialis]|uniref:Cadherin domain-containing protein n=1 Tax=Rotaria socialis TaxID=392032 RepID=A0A820EYN9_9BILA|nr:unnamed protein product [Rotaria socialis]CAF3344777.1 unnamed protein product [Rotaria socialis]CAF4117312.1 unnamed protein product [Rotaria socialis]CAF4253345.1 unnamed protein product [Rotaria socialis]